MNAQNAAQYLPFVKALAEGKKIRVGGVIIDEINFDMRIEMYRIDEVPSLYRIAPEPPRPVITPGKWRMRNGEVVTIKELDGPHYQWASVDRAWATWTADGKYTYAQIGNSPFDLISRVETKWRPWKPEEAPVGGVVRDKKLSYVEGRVQIQPSAWNRQLIVGTGLENASLGLSWHIPFDILLRDYELLLPDGTYAPCGVMEEAG